MEVVEGPSLYWISTDFRDRLAGDEFLGVIGSTMELNVIQECAAESGAPCRKPCKAVLMEAGLPCAQSHVVAPRPTLGFAGAISWAQRILDAFVALGA